MSDLTNKHLQSEPVFIHHEAAIGISFGLDETYKTIFIFIWEGVHKSENIQNTSAFKYKYTHTLSMKSRDTAEFIARTDTHVLLESINSNIII